MTKPGAKSRHLVGSEKLLPQDVVTALRERLSSPGLSSPWYESEVSPRIRCLACGLRFRPSHTALCVQPIGRKSTTYRIHANKDLCIPPEHPRATYGRPKGKWLIHKGTAYFGSLAVVEPVEHGFSARWVYYDTCTVVVGTPRYKTMERAQCAVERHAAREIQRIREVLRSDQ